MSRAYYNEIDPYAAQWLRNLIAAGHIAPGDVDERSIVDVRPDDLRGYAQCHFFAGIGGWSLALRLAGWDDARPVWTGSCPCQPFSAAGKRKGEADERHLWPVWFRLIKECRPEVVFGEQVASSEVVGTELEAAFIVAVREGRVADANRIAKRLARSKALHFHRRWVDGVSADMESEDYAFRFEVLGAHSVRAPHIRQRLWWVADADGRIAGNGHLQPSGQYGQQPQDGGAVERMADSQCDTGRPRRSREQPGSSATPTGTGTHAELGRCGGAGGLGDACSQGLSQRVGYRDVRSEEMGTCARQASVGTGAWSGSIFIPCADGKARRIEPGIQPLAHGVPNRVGRLRAYGNAIVAQVGAEFIASYAESQGFSLNPVSPIVT